MSGLGNKHVPVDCVTCNGTGKATGISKKLEYVSESCPFCVGTGKFTVSRKAS